VGQALPSGPRPPTAREERRGFDGRDVPRPCLAGPTRTQGRIRQLTEEEIREISYRRRILHGKIDILRAELVNGRNKHEGGEAVITATTSSASPTSSRRATRRPRARFLRMALHCTECGFVNGEGANYCQRCGALLPREEGAGDPATATYRIGETGELVPVELGEVTAHGPAFVIRAGGGRVGESFPVDGERMSIGRRPDSEVFLDDITVSRDHALLIHRGEDWYLDDCGSLNGTYVNRSRIESHHLQEGDEVQIGKYKLTFHVR
jgi:hypothetical protein